MLSSSFTPTTILSRRARRTSSSKGSLFALIHSTWTSVILPAFDNRSSAARHRPASARDSLEAVLRAHASIAEESASDASPISTRPSSSAAVTSSSYEIEPLSLPSTPRLPSSLVRTHNLSTRRNRRVAFALNPPLIVSGLSSMPRRQLLASVAPLSAPTPAARLESTFARAPRPMKLVRFNLTMDSSAEMASEEEEKVENMLPASITDEDNDAFSSRFTSLRSLTRPRPTQIGIGCPKWTESYDPSPKLAVLRSMAFSKKSNEMNEWIDYSDASLKRYLGFEEFQKKRSEERQAWVCEGLDWSEETGDDDEYFKNLPSFD